MMNQLIDSKIIKVSLIDISDFIVFLQNNHVTFYGGAIENDGSQWLYTE